MSSFDWRRWAFTKQTSWSRIPKPSTVPTLNLAIFPLLTDWRWRPCVWMMAFDLFAIMMSGQERCVAMHFPANARSTCSSAVSVGPYVHCIRNTALSMPAIPSRACVSKFFSHTSSKIMRQALALPMPMCKTMDQASTTTPTCDLGPKRACRGSVFESYGF